jgi:hypothetical protein
VAACVEEGAGSASEPGWLKRPTVGDDASKINKRGRSNGSRYCFPRICFPMKLIDIFNHNLIVLIMVIDYDFE